MLNRFERKQKDKNKFKKRVMLNTHRCIMLDSTTNAYSRRFKKFSDLTEKELNDFNKFRKQGKPCSCPMCSFEKYSRKVKYKKDIFKD